MRAIDVVRRLAPRARPAYVSAFETGDKVLSDYGVTTPLRLAHFLAQVMHETDGLTIERESGAYSAPRLLEIFGEGRHSAAITPAEAQKLAKDGPAIFERVYGLGNPRKAKELGNTQAGDGWKYRGNGIMQTTGRGNHRRMSEKVGLGDLFERDPSQVTAAAYALLPALAEWKESGCNALADQNDIRSITRRINGGLNGFDDRVSWFNRIYPLLKGGVDLVPSSPPKAEEGAPAAKPAPAPPPSPKAPSKTATQVGGAVAAGTAGAAAAAAGGVPWWEIGLAAAAIALIVFVILSSRKGK